MVDVLPIFLAQQISIPSHFGQAFRFWVPQRTDHECRHSLQMNRQESISILPPSTERLFELMRKSATFLCAEETMFPKVCRDIFILPAASSLI